MRRAIGVGAASAAFLYLFFFEYLPPFQWVHIPYDLAIYHYSLADYAFRAARAGRFPVWDPTMYCGLSFAGNIQAALFYPPTWLLFAANWGRGHVSYLSLEIFVLAHLWLAFVLCRHWLRRRGISTLSSLLGAGVYAFGGYACLQLQHLGLIAAYAWFPLGLEGVDEAAERKTWRPLLKLTAASALAFLAGYPPTWLAFAVCAGVYALFRPLQIRVVLGTVLALAASLAVSAIQLWPAWEANSAQSHEAHYGAGFHDPSFFLAFLVPNYFNFGGHVSIFENPGREYLYLGAPALLGLVLLLRRRDRGGLLPCFAIAAAAAVFIVNPYNLVWNVIRHSALLSDLCRSYYFLALIPLALAPLAGFGIDGFLRRKSAMHPPWVAAACIVLIAAYCVWQLRRWTQDSFASGPRSIYDPVLTLVLLAITLYLLRSQSGPAGSALAVAIVLLVACDYKVFGSSKRFNADRGPFPSSYIPEGLAGMEEETFREIQSRPEFRVLLDTPGSPFPLELRHVGLTTPQGFDPFFPSAFRQSLAQTAQFTSDREFVIPEQREDALQLYGVRYLVTSPAGRFYRDLVGNPSYRPVDRDESWLRVFEYRKAHPPYGWETEDQGQRVELRQWAAERRVFDVRSAQGGPFTLREDFLPGWKALLDGQPAPVEPWKAVFQAVRVPAGSHRVEFYFSAESVWRGGLVSAASLILLVAAAAFSRRRERI